MEIINNGTAVDYSDEIAQMDACEIAPCEGTDVDYCDYEVSGASKTGLKLFLGLVGAGAIGGMAFLGHKLYAAKKCDKDIDTAKATRKEKRLAKERAKAIALLRSAGYDILEPDMEYDEEIVEEEE